MVLSERGKANLMGAMPGAMTALESKLRHFDQGTRGWEEAGAELRGSYFRALDEYAELGVLVGFGQAQVEGDEVRMVADAGHGQRTGVSGVLLRKREEATAWAAIGRSCAAGKSLWDFVEPLVVVNEQDCPNLHNLTQLVYDRVNQRRLESLPTNGDFRSDLGLGIAVVDLKHSLAEEGDGLKSRMAEGGIGVPGRDGRRGILSF